MLTSNLTKDIQKAVQKCCVLKGHPVVCPNISISSGYWECDVLSITGSDVVYEYEVKVSRSDFLADRKKKKKHTHYANARNPVEWKPKAATIPHHMIYVVPDGLVSVDEVPEFAGLWYFRDGELEVIKPSVKLHDATLDTAKIKSTVLRMYIERDALGCTRLSYENKLIKEREAKREQERTEQFERLMQWSKENRESGIAINSSENKEV